jgi:K+-transporting ATPase KdpF subunit
MLIEGCRNARSRDAVFHSDFLRGGFSLRKSMPEIEVAMDLIAIVALILSIFLLGYLTVSLLFPEKF